MFKAVTEIFYGNSGALCVIVFNAGTFAALTAYGDVKCLVALFFEFIYGDVLADFNAALDLRTESLDYVDFGSDNILFELELGIPYVIIPPGMGFFSNTVGL